MGTERAVLALAMTAMLCACTLDRAGLAAEGCHDGTSCPGAQACVDGRCIDRIDANLPQDASTDASRDADSTPTDTAVDGAPDAGPAHCTNGALDPSETDTDCGGPCAPCASCNSCATPTDCASGDCVDGRCAAELSTIVTVRGEPIPAFVRDGAVLLAHYAPGTFHIEYDPHRAQRMDAVGGSTPPPRWAPDPCLESGHLDFSLVAPAGRTVRLECGPDVDTPQTVVGSALFDSFTLGDYGAVGGIGTPGWATISSIGSSRGRSTYAICGSDRTHATGGIGYCNGAVPSFANHLVSYTVFTGGGNPYVGCGGVGCNGPSCPTHVWVWLTLP